MSSCPNVLVDFPPVCCCLQISKQRRCPRLCSLRAQLCQLCHCSPLAECVQPSINSSQWSFSPWDHHSLCSQNKASLYSSRLSAPPTWGGVRGDRLEFSDWHLKKSKRVFGIIAKSRNYFLIIALLWLRDGVLRNVLSLSWLWCKHMWAEAHYRAKLHLDCTTETALSARHAKTTIRLPKRGNVPYTAAFKTQIRQTTQLKLLTVLNPARLFSHPVHTK